MTEPWHRLHVALRAQIAQWRFHADQVTATDGAAEDRAQALRECAYDLERLLAMTWPSEETQAP